MKFLRKLTSEKVLNIVCIFVLFFTQFIKALSLSLEKLGMLNDHNSLNPATFLYEVIPILIFIYIRDIIKTKRKLDIFDYIFYALVVSGIISVIFSIDKSIAIFGTYYRHSGFLSMLTYYLLFINYKVKGNSKAINNVYKALIIIGILNSIYALLQTYTSFSFIYRFSEYSIMASGLVANPNFLGSLMVTLICLIICKIFINKEIKKSDYFITALFFITLINCQSSGPFFTFILVYIFLIAILSVRRNIVFKNLIIMTSILVFVFLTVNFANNNIKFIRKNALPNCEFCISGIKNTINSGGNGRLEIWKNSIGVIKKNFITGVGFDNFHLAYPNKHSETYIYITNEKIETVEYKQPIVDNAHNVYIQTLAVNGIIGFIPFILLLLLTFIKGLKSKNKNSLILFAGFVAYSIQAFANINVVYITSIYYVLIGLILSIKE